MINIKLLLNNSKIKRNDLRSYSRKAENYERTIYEEFIEDYLREELNWEELNKRTAFSNRKIMTYGSFPKEVIIINFEELSFPHADIKDGSNSSFINISYAIWNEQKSEVEKGSLSCEEILEILKNKDLKLSTNPYWDVLQKWLDNSLSNLPSRKANKKPLLTLVTFNGLENNNNPYTFVKKAIKYFVRNLENLEETLEKEDLVIEFNELEGEDETLIIIPSKNERLRFKVLRILLNTSPPVKPRSFVPQKWEQSDNKAYNNWNALNHLLREMGEIWDGFKTRNEQIFPLTLAALVRRLTSNYRKYDFPNIKHTEYYEKIKDPLDPYYGNFILNILLCFTWRNTINTSVYFTNPNLNKSESNKVYIHNLDNIKVYNMPMTWGIKGDINSAYGAVLRLPLPIGLPTVKIIDQGKIVTYEDVKGYGWLVVGSNNFDISYPLLVLTKNSEKTIYLGLTLELFVLINIGYQFHFERIDFMDINNNLKKGSKKFKRLISLKKRMDKIPNIWMYSTIKVYENFSLKLFELREELENFPVKDKYTKWIIQRVKDAPRFLVGKFASKEELFIIIKQLIKKREESTQKDRKNNLSIILEIEDHVNIIDKSKKGWVPLLLLGLLKEKKITREDKITKASLIHAIQYINIIIFHTVQSYCFLYPQWLIKIKYSNWREIFVRGDLDSFLLTIDNLEEKEREELALLLGKLDSKWKPFHFHIDYWHCGILTWSRREKENKIDIVRASSTEYLDTELNRKTQGNHITVNQTVEIIPLYYLVKYFNEIRVGGTKWNKESNLNNDKVWEEIREDIIINIGKPLTKLRKRIVIKIINNLPVNTKQVEEADFKKWAEKWKVRWKDTNKGIKLIKIKEKERKKYTFIHETSLPIEEEDSND